MSTRVSRRRFLSLTVMAAAGATLAACGATPTSTPVPPAATKPPAAPAAAPTVATTGKKVTVDFQNWWNAQRQPLMDTVIANFQALNPDIIVQNNVLPADNQAERASTAMASKTPPGLLMSLRGWTYNFAKQGLIIPIDDYVTAAKLDLAKTFYPAEVNNQRWAGKLYSLPMPTAGGLSSMMMYNKTLFTKAGLDPNKPPTTWQELDAAGRKLTVMKGNAMDVNGWDFQQNGGLGVGFCWCLLTNNCLIASADGKQSLLNSAEAVDTLTWLVKYTNEANGGIQAVMDFYTNQSITSPDWPMWKGRMGIMNINTSHFSHLQTQNPAMFADTSQWGIMLRPYNGANAKATNAGESGLSGGWGYVIAKALPKEVQDAAYKFVEYLGTQQKGGCDFLFAQNRPSPVIACNSNPAYAKGNPYWDTVLKALATDVSVPITPVEPQIDALINTAVESALYGKGTPKQVLDDCYSKAQKLLDDFWKA